MTVGILVALAIALGLLCIIMVMVRREAALPSPERTRAVGPRTAQEGTATHEAGHAILAWLSPFVREVTGLILEENGDGVTTVLRSRITSSVRLWDVIAIGLAGIAAEGYAFGRIRSSESRRDLGRAREWAERLVRENADPLATFPWTEPTSRSTLDIGRMFAQRPDETVCAVMNLAYRHAKHVIAQRPAALRALVAAAQKKKRLTRQDIEAVLGPRPWALAL